MRAAASRRTLLCGIAVLPALGGAALADTPSDLASACDWATAQWAALEDPARGGRWSDDRHEAEAKLYYAVYRRAIAEPSRTRADVAAKARMLLADYESSLFPYLDPAENAKAEAELNDHERLIRVVLREAGALDEWGGCA